jgi:hypothetical protein
MTDVRDFLRQGLSEVPGAPDLVGIAHRSRQLARRRSGGRLIASVAVLGVVGASALSLSTRGDRDVLIPGDPTPQPSSVRVVMRIVNLTFSGGCADLQGVKRTILATPEPLAATLGELFAGPNADERARGVTSMFNGQTGGLLRSVHVAGGHAYVDLESRVASGLALGIPYGCDRSPFAEQVAVTLQQFPGVHDVFYALDGDPVTFAAAAGLRCPQLPAPGGLCDPAPFRAGSQATPSTHASPGLWPADYDLPAAGVCGTDDGPIATVDANPDQPAPRCLIVRADQRLRVRNTTNNFKQPGQTITVQFAGYPARRLAVGEETLFDRPMGEYLAAGVHDVHLSVYQGSGGGEIWLKP